MQLTGAEIIVECLKEQGVDTVFGYPGGAILNVYDALYEYKDQITHVLTSHGPEQSFTFRCLWIRAIRLRLIHVLGSIYPEYKNRIRRRLKQKTVKECGKCWPGGQDLLPSFTVFFDLI